MMEKIGTIYRDNRDTYLVLEADGEVYYFSAGRFYMGLTKFADNGCKLKEIEDRVELLAEESEE